MSSSQTTQNQSNKKILFYVTIKSQKPKVVNTKVTEAENSAQAETDRLQQPQSQAGRKSHRSRKSYKTRSWVETKNTEKLEEKIEIDKK